MASKTKSGINTMTNTVCSVVVTYNRKNLLVKCIDALINQELKPDAIYIVDNNSTDQTQQTLYEHKYIDEMINENSSNIQQTEKNYENIIIRYIHLPENVGGAGGFYEGVKQAHEDQYDWVWIMDDDAYPTLTCLKNLQPYYNLPDISALASLKVDMDDNILYHHRGYFNFEKGLPIQEHITDEDLKEDVIDVDMVSFVGLLLKSTAIDKIGYPKREFFIHTDDLEYCIRLRQVGKIKLIKNSIIKHAEGSVKGTYTKKVLNIKAKRRPYDKLWINYYMQRNLIWLGRKYTKNKTSLYTTILKNYLLTVMGIIVFDDHKYKRLKFFTNAYIDGLTSHFDNKKPRKILYE
ncbi:galactofuranosyl transferase GlfT1 [Methanosphaera cuniculi]|uniref:Galactofuranosyl transferase GlfT1 n=3 Tax=Methanosphaera cuniculi TaxID=1077256 RepID=A0A2V2BNI6_9EURY|nr:galactofuranosyl transferase GlfT1 [Methanosphaera cuniculi]